MKLKYFYQMKLLYMLKLKLGRYWLLNIQAETSIGSFQITSYLHGTSIRISLKNHTNLLVVCNLV